MRLLPVVLLLGNSPVVAQGQSILFSFANPASGVNVHGTTATFGVRAGAIGGSHAAVVPLAAGMNEPQLAPSLIAACAQNQIGLAPSPSASNVAEFLLTGVEGALPARGCLFGTDDTGIAGFVGEITGGGTTRFFGAAFPKAATSAATNGVLTIEVVGRSTTDGHVFGVTSQLQIAAGETAAAINLRVRNDLIAKGCTVFDLAIPSFTNASATIAGFGVDRFDGLAGSQLGHQFRVSKIAAFRSGGARAVPAVIGLGWFPTGGFAEYGSGFAAAGREPYVRGSGDFAPGGCYDVTLEYHHHEVGMLVAATGRGALALPGGATLLLDPTTVVATTPFVTGPHGTAKATQQTPNDPAVIGQTVHWQGFAVHAGAVAATSGLYVRIWP
ncbi:MAG: hypothetical protein JNK15_11470 [Planctomycetes bacterium]|nr:hypothetical protein [Planctomycetota bacterium]